MSETSLAWKLWLKDYYYLADWFDKYGIVVADKRSLRMLDMMTILLNRAGDLAYVQTADDDKAVDYLIKASRLTDDE